ncbi:Holliday junction resolvase RuvX [Planctomycetota bacterium]
MRYLAIDYGAKRTGLAVCDAEEILASPLRVIESSPALCEHILQVIVELDIEALVLGLPFNMDGTEGFQAKAVRDFSNQLTRLTDLPIHYQDERLSSYAAREKRPDMRGRPGRRGKPLDALAAAEILAAFLEQKREA